MQPTFLETLEPRIAPAVLANNTVQFQDADGDIVTVEVNNVLSRIAKIVINGQISGGEPDDQYGFVAGSFGKVSLNGTNFAQPAPGGTTDVLLDGSVKLHRVTTTSL